MSSLRHSLLLAAVVVASSLGAVVPIASAAAQDRVEVCHIPPNRPERFETRAVSSWELDSHLAHGDLEGRCDDHCATLCDERLLCTVDDTQHCEVAREVDCSDQDLCTSDSYYNGSCQHIARRCSGGNEACNPKSGVCEVVDCTDQDLCTLDSFDPKLGCGHVAKVCSGAYEACNPKNGVCEAIPPVDPNKWYYLTNARTDTYGSRLEGNIVAPGSRFGGAAFMSPYSDTSGVVWKFTPMGNGYYHMTTMFLESKGYVFEGNKPGANSILGGAAFMSSQTETSGTMWKIVRLANGYYQLTTKFLESEGYVLDGNNPRPGQVVSIMGGVAFMSLQTGSAGTMWKFVAVGN